MTSGILFKRFRLFLCFCLTTKFLVDFMSRKTTMCLILFFSRYNLDAKPVITFQNFEETFGVPPIGKTKAPSPKCGFGFEHQISVAQAYAKIFEAARQPGFNLKELLPASCFVPNGRILMPQMREYLARIRLNLNDENFRRLWNQ